ncbi:unnamed protein product, partial [Ectocarpus sp. 13 AM-2016]
FTGSTPPELGNLAVLQVLNLGGNELSGEFSAQHDNCKIRRVDKRKIPARSVQKFRGRQLGGTRSTEIDNSQRAISYYSPRVRTNLLRTGSIPKELGDLRKLRQLWLNSNRLTGPIPPELGNLAALQRLHLGGNTLSG